MKLVDSYKKNIKYYTGGPLDGIGIDGEEATEDSIKSANFSKAAGLIAGVSSGIIDATAKPDPTTGRTPTGAVVGKSALSGAATGAQFGPLGAGVGAVVGAGLGLLQAGKEKKEAIAALDSSNRLKKISESNQSAARLATNPELLTGYKRSSYFAMGGDMKAPLSAMYMKGGNAKPLSSDSTELIGNGHENGGIKVPGIGAELEGGETTSGSYVFSKDLGFAELQRPIGLAKGIIEKKPATAERINSMKRLQNREKELALMQEYIKSQM